MFYCLHFTFEIVLWKLNLSVSAFVQEARTSYTSESHEALRSSIEFNCITHPAPSGRNPSNILSILSIPWHTAAAMTMTEGVFSRHHFSRKLPESQRPSGFTSVSSSELTREHVSEPAAMLLKVSGRRATCLSVLRIPFYWIWSTAGSNVSSHTNLYFWQRGMSLCVFLAVAWIHVRSWSTSVQFLLHVNIVSQYAERRNYDWGQLISWAFYLKWK